MVLQQLQGVRLQRQLDARRQASAQRVQSLSRRRAPSAHLLAPSRTAAAAEMAVRRLRLVAGGRHSRRPRDAAGAPSIGAAGEGGRGRSRTGLGHYVREDQWLLPAATPASKSTGWGGQHCRRGQRRHRISVSRRQSSSSRRRR